MYLWHFAGVNVIQKALLLLLPANWFNRIEIWGLWRCWPPVDSTNCIVFSSQIGAMLRIIVLNESEPIWINILDEGYYWFIQNWDEERCIHLPLKDAQISAATTANPCPHMTLYRTFRLSSISWCLSFLAACSAVCLNLHRSLVCVNEITKWHAFVLLSPLKSFFLY